MRSDVEYPGRYEAARTARIYANASKTRRRKHVEAMRAESPEFKLWLDMASPVLYFEAGVEIFGVTKEEYSAKRDAVRKNYGNPPAFLGDALEKWGGLTEKQMAFAKKIFAERSEKFAARSSADAERKATAPAWTVGRHEVTGVIKSARYETFAVNPWVSTTTLKGMVLLPDGRKLWTTIPKALDPIANEVTYENEKAIAMLVGSTITFTVTVEPSKDDATMGFGKRPTAKKVAVPETTNETTNEPATEVAVAA